MIGQLCDVCRRPLPDGSRYRHETCPTPLQWCEDCGKYIAVTGPLALLVHEQVKHTSRLGGRRKQGLRRR